MINTLKLLSLSPAIDIIRRMFEKIWLILSEGYTLDDDRRLSIINITNKSYAETFPVRFSQMFATLRYRTKDSSYFKGSIVFEVIYYLGDKKIGSVTLDAMEVEMDRNGHILPIPIHDFIYPEPGDYTIKIYVNDKLVAEEQTSMRLTSDLQEA